MAGFWKRQADYWNQERVVPGRNDNRKMRLWVFEAGYFAAWIAIIALVAISPGGDATGVDALPGMFVTFGAIAGAYLTGGYGLSYALDRLTRKKEKSEPVSE